MHLWRDVCEPGLSKNIRHLQILQILGSSFTETAANVMLESYISSHVCVFHQTVNALVVEELQNRCLSYIGQQMKMDAAQKSSTEKISLLACTS